MRIRVVYDRQWSVGWRELAVQSLVGTVIAPLSQRQKSLYEMGKCLLHLGEREDLVYMEDVHCEPRELSLVNCRWHTIPSR